MLTHLKKNFLSYQEFISNLKSIGEDNPELIKNIGENIRVKRFTRYVLGE